MDTKKFVTAIERLHAKQAVMLRFSEEGLPGLKRLNGLVATNPNVTIDTKAMVLMLAVLRSTNWAGSDNRNYIVNGLQQAGDELLIQLARDIEDVQLVDDHAAKALMTSRQRARKEAADKLIDQIATPEFIKELNGWDMIIDCKLEELEGLPLLKFMAVFEKMGVVTVSIDGWSGRIVANNVWGDELYTDPKQVQKLMLERVEYLLDRVTAPQESAAA